MLNSQVLVLVPTERELELLRQHLAPAPNMQFELCGFGLVAAAARTAQLLQLRQPSHVLLAGIAGQITDQVSCGQAYEFGSVACYGIGAGQGSTFQTAADMGWSHWNHPQVGDVLTVGSAENELQLLTCCAASENAVDVEQKRGKFPNAAAEDMEGFAVAAACKLSSVPLRIVRGISNVAGDRDQSHWQVEQAMLSVANLLRNSFPTTT